MQAEFPQLAELKVKIAAAAMSVPDAQQALDFFGSAHRATTPDQLLAVVNALIDVASTAQDLIEIRDALEEQLVTARFPEGSVRRILAFATIRTAQRTQIIRWLEQLDEDEVIAGRRAVVGAVESLIGRELTFCESQTQAAVPFALNEHAIPERSESFRLMARQALELRLRAPTTGAKNFLRVLQNPLTDEFAAKVMKFFLARETAEASSSLPAATDANRAGAVLEPPADASSAGAPEVAGAEHFPALFKLIALGIIDTAPPGNERKVSFVEAFARLGEAAQSAFKLQLKARIAEVDGDDVSEKKDIVSRIRLFIAADRCGILAELNLTENFLLALVMKYKSVVDGRILGAALALIAREFYEIVSVPKGNVDALKQKWDITFKSGTRKSRSAQRDEAAPGRAVDALSGRAAEPEIADASGSSLVAYISTLSSDKPIDVSALIGKEPNATVILAAVGEGFLEGKITVELLTAVYRTLHQHQSCNPNAAAQLAIENSRPYFADPKHGLSRLNQAIKLSNSNLKEGGEFVEHLGRELSVAYNKNVLGGTPQQHRQLKDFEAFVADGELISIQTLVFREDFQKFVKSFLTKAACAIARAGDAKAAAQAANEYITRLIVHRQFAPQYISAKCFYPALRRTIEYLATSYKPQRDLIEEALRRIDYPDYSCNPNVNSALVNVMGSPRNETPLRKVVTDLTNLEERKWFCFFAEGRYEDAFDHLVELAGGGCSELTQLTALARKLSANDCVFVGDAQVALQKSLGKRDSVYAALQSVEKACVAKFIIALGLTMPALEV